MRKLVLLTITCLWVFCAFSQLKAQSDYLKTFYELSDYKETPRYDETVEYSQKLAKLNHMITYTSFGISPQGRDLPLMIIDKNGFTKVEDVRKAGRAIVLIQAGIHAGEIDGKDAGFMLIRDMITGKIPDVILENVTILFVPIFNVDGHEMFNAYNRINQNGPKEMGWRTTAQRLNLNRDYLKADAPEMKSMIQLYQNWMPDFYIDCHVTDGADYIYPLTYGLQMYGNLCASQTEWLKNNYLSYVEKEMKTSGYPIAPYMDFVEWHNPKSGIKAYIESPRYSGGYSAVNNRPALLIEAHSLKDYKTRVTATYQMLLNSLELISDEKNKLLQINAEADKQASSLYVNKNPYPLTFNATTAMSLKPLLIPQRLHSNLTGEEEQSKHLKKSNEKGEHATEVICWAILPPVQLSAVAKVRFFDFNKSPKTTSID